MKPAINRMVTCITAATPSAELHGSLAVPGVPLDALEQDCQVRRRSEKAEDVNQNIWENKNLEKNIQYICIRK